MISVKFKYLLLASVISILFSCSNDEIDNTPAPNTIGEFTIYDGDKISFMKADGSDASLEANQDRINDDVWITRGNGGEIFNGKTESRSTKGESPEGTEWAQGRTDNIESLNFTSFRTAITPKDVVGKNLVLHLIEEDAYVDVMFTSWTSGKSGGFAYERSTK